jgi:hypothetical protein
VDRKLVIGKRAHGIVTFGIQHKVDLIVLSSHRVQLTDFPKGWYRQPPSVNPVSVSGLVGEVGNECTACRSTNSSRLWHSSARNW